MRISILILSVLYAKTLTCIKRNIKEEKEVKEPTTITITKSDDWQSIEVNGAKIENHKLDVDDFTDVLKELGFKVNVVWEDSDV